MFTKMKADLCTKEKVQFINNVEDAKDILLRLIELDMETIIDTILE